VDAPKDLIDVINDQFNNRLDKHEEEYVMTLDITDAIRRHPIYSRYRKEIIRQKAKKFK
jgi:hypothetical protein